MSRSFPREHLQPVLLDRLDDDLTSGLNELATKRHALEQRLDPNQAAALKALLAGDASPPHPARSGELAPFQDLDEQTRALLARVLELDQACRLEARRAYGISMAQLRTSVLRELGHLLNAESPETMQVDTPQGRIDLFDGFPLARRSILNYGIPPLAGRIRTLADCAELAKAVERIIQNFEPRLTRVRVSCETLPEGGQTVIKSPVVLIIEGELWGYPLPESLRIRTFLDLEDGQARIEEASQTEAA